MEDLFPIVILIAIVAAIALGGTSLGSSATETPVIKACEQRGYWQSGQTRVICTVEKPKQ